MKWPLFILAVFTALQILIICIYLRKEKGLDEMNRFSAKTAQPVLELCHNNPTLDSLSSAQLNTSQVSIAVGLAITTKRSEPSSSSALGITCPFFKSLLLSFCRTASEGYRYKFYLAYDANDKYFSQASFRVSFINTFADHVDKNCPGKSSYSIHVIRCNYSDHPAWAQNDAMIEAYLDDVDYFYRVNDDVIMQTVGWTEMFINTLARFTPPNVGVVGPSGTRGNNKILTFDFVHKTHMDIFGFYYPRLFKGWFADDWITEVYKPKRSCKLASVRLLHTFENRRRYIQRQWISNISKCASTDKETLQRFLLSTTEKFPSDKLGRKVVAMAVSNNDPDDIWGTLRNTQLIRIFLPDWTLRVFISNSSMHELPARILHKLLTMGATLSYVSDTLADVAPVHMWSYLIADEKDVEYFLIRQPKYSFSELDAVTIHSWISSNATFHCIRDHPLHKVKAIVKGLWGARRNRFRSVLGTSMLQILENYLKNNTIRKDFEDDFLIKCLWPVVQGEILCHDSVSGDVWPGSVPFNMTRKSKRTLAEHYDRNENIIHPEPKMDRQLHDKEQCVKEISKRV